MNDFERILNRMKTITHAFTHQPIYWVLDICQDEPSLIAETPEEADELIDLWERGLIVDGQLR